MQTPPPDSAPSNYPRPNLAGGSQDLREVATGQRQIMYCILAQIAVMVLNGIAASGKIVALSFVDLFLALGVLVFMVISVIRLAKAMGLSPTLYAILMFVPCVSLIVLLMLSSKATTQLRQAGIKVGLLGADPKSI